MKKILIITFTEDNECVPMVQESVKARNAQAYRLDTDLFPTDLPVSLEETPEGRRLIVTTREGELDLAEVSAIWYRRSRVGLNIPREMDPKLRKPSVDESKAVFFGLMESLDVFTLERFHKVRYAANKELQLHIARKVGLEIPRTLTTNNQEAVRRFFPTCPNGMITKMLSSFSIYEDNVEKVVFTSKVEEKDLEEMEGLSFCPMTFQENVPKKLELRVTIVGNRVFAAAIDSQKSTKAQNDWRKDGVGLLEDWEKHDLPVEIETKLLKLMDELKVNYGAIDIILTPDDRYVFLEINPAGEFFWLQNRSPYFPLSDAIADVLLGVVPRR